MAAADGEANRGGSVIAKASTPTWRLPKSRPCGGVTGALVGCFGFLVIVAVAVGLSVGTLAVLKVGWGFAELFESE